MTRDNEKAESRLPPPLCKGLAGQIVLLDDAEKAYREIEKRRNQNATKQHARIDRYFGRFCNEGAECLDADQFKFQARYTTPSGKSIAIWEFKAWQWRLYGVLLTVDDLNTFIGACVNDQKKKNKADKNDFIRTARIVDAYVKRESDVGKK